MAPRSQDAAVGAPNTGSTESQAKPPDGFAGVEIRKPLLNTPARSEAERERRKQWLPDFLAKGGLAKFIALLQNLARHRSQRGTGTESIRANDEIVKSCLSEVMECIRVLLISSFCANSTDPSVTLSL